METNKDLVGFEDKLVNSEKIPIYILDAEAKKFLVFQQYYEPIALLIDKKVFEQKNATISLDFDKFGVLRSIRRQDFLFSSRV